MAASYKKQLPEPLVPFSIEAEEAILGSILLDPEAYQRTCDLVAAGDFFRDQNREVWEAIERCLAHGREPDVVTVVYEVAQDDIERLRIASLLSRLVATTPTPVHARYYAQIVRETAECRRAIQLAGQTAAAAFNGDLDMVRRLQAQAPARGRRDFRGPVL